MGGGSSKSSSSSSNETTTSTATSTGTVGDVVQGQTVTINQNLPQTAVDVFQQLVTLAQNSENIAAQAGQKALDSTNALATATKQPDVSVVQGSQTQITYMIMAIAAIMIIPSLFGKK